MTMKMLFRYPLKTLKKASGDLMVSVGIEMNIWLQWVNILISLKEIALTFTSISSLKFIHDS